MLVRRYFYACDVEEILKIKIPCNACQDCVAWNFEKSGLFSVKSAYSTDWPCGESTVKGRLTPALVLLMVERCGKICGLLVLKCLRTSKSLHGRSRITVFLLKLTSVTDILCNMKPVSCVAMFGRIAFMHACVAHMLLLFARP